MTDSPFSDPGATGGGFNNADHLNRLCLFTVKGYDAQFATAAGTGPKVDADVVVLDGPDAGAEYPDSFVFGRVLTGQLRPRVGAMVLGRVGQGEAKAGKSAPWVLSDPTEADRELGLKHLAKVKASAAPPF